MKNDGFAAFHPAVNFVFFLFVIALSVTNMHPVCLIISLVCAVTWAVILDKKRAARFFLTAVLPMMLLTAIINPLFNHQGQTILTYFPNGNPLTLESLIYGAAAALMLGSLLMWFFCFNRIMGADKLTYLLGKAALALALLFSMSLRFAPRFAAKFREVSKAQKGLYGATEGERLSLKIKRGLNVLSITVTWALENAVETADSMKSRGYGLSGRTAFSIYRFCTRDGVLLALILLFGGVSVISAATGLIGWQYFPSLAVTPFGTSSMVGFFAYLCLCATPAAIDIIDAVNSVNNIAHVDAPRPRAKI